MKAADVLVRCVITVVPDASVQHVASVLRDNRVSAVRVVSDDATLVLAGNSSP